MKEIIDFSKCQRYIRPFGGTDRKFGVIYNGEGYMLKFSENHAKKTDISTSHVNNVISEYISSHIAATTGLPVHETVLGVYKKGSGSDSEETDNKELVVGCKDFREPNEENIEFRELVRAVYESKAVKRVISLDQIYHTLEDTDIFSDELKEQSICRYWDTFVIDALVGNFDRHVGDWGYLSNGYELKLAPIYDFGCTLLSQISDEGISSIINDEFEMKKRCFVFPSPALYISSDKVGKVGYYDMLASGFDYNCSAAVKRIVPLIDMTKIDELIDETPCITELKNEFLHKYIHMRKELILDRAFEHCIANSYDKDAIYRLENGIQISDDLDMEI